MQKKIDLKKEYYSWLLDAVRLGTLYGGEYSGEDERLNRTEKLLLNVVRFKTAAGEKIISTQIADYLNVTRSAVSQTVSRLEARGYICRESSDTDKKISYICLSEREEQKFERDMEREREIIAAVTAEMGEAQLDELSVLGNKFFRTVRMVKQREENMNVKSEKQKERKIRRKEC